MRTLPRIFAVTSLLPALLAISATVASAQPAPPAQPQPPPAAPPPKPANPEGAPKDEPLLPAAKDDKPAAKDDKPAAKGDKKDEAPPAPDPDRDAKQLAKQGRDRPSIGDVGAKPSDVYAEEWWSSARPVFEIHGYYRLRAELFHNFALGRRDPNPLLWPQPADNDYIFKNGVDTHQVKFCGAIPADGSQPKDACTSNTNAGANMRFRLNPELHISDNLRVMAQIDLLDNLVLGSTPEGYSNQPINGGYAPNSRGGYAPIGAFVTTQWTPIAGVNSTNNSVSVKRVWGEYTTPIGVLRFGRMPSHWGLGMMVNSGDGYDSDWQSTADRIMLVTGIKKYDIYFAGMWDFANEGATSGSFAEFQGQPYDLGQFDDVNQYALAAVRRRNPELQKLELAKGQVVINGGVYFVYRNQFLANDEVTPSSGAGLTQKQTNLANGFVRRGAQAYIPDIWFQFLYKKFRFEIEAAMIYGSLENTLSTQGSFNFKNSREPTNTGWKIRQFGIATESEFRALNDKLRVQFGFGWASGDPDVDGLSPGQQGLQPQLTANRTFSTFRFHPDYRVDLILFRNILTRVQGAYYFKPSVEYDFLRDRNGQRLGGGASVIWSRASEFIQSPGHSRDLGIELNAKIYYQSKDGSMNDDPDRMGGFFTMLQYGVLFPLGGLAYLPGEQDEFAQRTGIKLETATAQTLRWYLGILF